jgi:uncharacterized membrane protein
MIAPSFIFIAGFAFSLALEKKWDDFQYFKKPFWLQLRRILFILALGYWLHLTTWSFQSVLRYTPEQLLYILRADVLQLIGLSLLFSLILCVTLRNKNMLVGTLLLLGLLNIFLTPFIYDVDPRDYLPALPASYINSHSRALFPLFPWSAYAFLGTFTGWIYLKAARKGMESKFFLTTAILGTLMFFGGLALLYDPWQYHSYADPSKASPRSFMLKLGFIFLLLSALWLYERKRKPVQSILNIVGQESLFVYGFHLLIVYGSVFTPHNISWDVGPNLTYIPSFFISAMLIASMTICAVLWHGLKTRRPRIAKTIFYGFWALYFLRFFRT